MVPGADAPTKCACRPTDARLRFVHVDDLVNALLTCVDRPAAGVRRSNVAHPEEVPRWTLRLVLAAACGAPPDVRHLHASPRPMHPLRVFPFLAEDFRPDPSALVTSLGWRPSHRIAEGMRQTLAAMNPANLRQRPLWTRREEEALTDALRSATGGQ